MSLCRGHGSQISQQPGTRFLVKPLERCLGSTCHMGQIATWKFLILILQVNLAVVKSTRAKKSAKRC